MFDLRGDLENDLKNAGIDPGRHLRPRLPVAGYLLLASIAGMAVCTFWGAVTCG